MEVSVKTKQKTEFDESDIARLIEVKKQIEALSKEESELKSKIMGFMKEKDIESFETDEINVALVESYTRESLDSKKLKEEQPELYKKYTKTSEVKESLQVKLKATKVLAE